MVLIPQTEDVYCAVRPECLNIIQTNFEVLMWSENQFLGAFTKWRKVAVSFVTSVCPSVLKSSVATRWVFMKFDIWVFFENLSRKFNTYVHLWQCLVEFFLEWEMFRTKVVEKIKTRVFCSVPFSPSENRALCDIKWKNVVKRDRLQMAIWRMRIACWIPNATDTQLEYVTIIAFPLQQWLHERAWMLCYTYVHSLHCYELYPYLVLLLL